MRGLAAVDLERLAVALHPRCRVDRVSEQAVARHLHPHHAGAARTWGAACYLSEYLLPLFGDSDI